jgi:hypothetical protein
LITAAATLAISFGVMALTMQDQPGWTVRALGGVATYGVVWTYALVRASYGFGNR